MKRSQWALLVLLTIFSHESRGQVKVDQKPLVSSTEGENLTITCQYETSNFYGLHWYKQYPGEGPTFLFVLMSEEPKTDSKLSAVLYKQKTLSNLHISDVGLGDAATYFCAVDSGTGWKLTFGTGTTLAVIPDIPDSKPSVYKLQPTDEKGKDISACLFTDYSPAEKESFKAKMDDSEFISVDSSVVVVKDPEGSSQTASYGAVLWGPKNDKFKCSAWHKNKTFDESDESIPAQSEGSTESDSRLSLLSLTVLGLRVIFFKTVAVNLLITLQLWSR